MASLLAPDGGRSLPEQLRRRLEAQLGAPLRGVRVHDDEQAEDLASGLGARAVTRGEHVHFARGEFHPDTPTGHDLLAHELAHVVQQRSGPGATGSRATAEAEAEAAGRGEATPTAGLAPSGGAQLAVEPRGRARYPDLPWDDFAKAYSMLTPAEQRQLDYEEGTSPRAQAARSSEMEAWAARGTEPGPLAKVKAAAATANEVAGEVVSGATGLTLINMLRNLGPAQQGEELAAAANDRTLTFTQIAEALDTADAPERVAFAFMKSELTSPLMLSRMSATQEGRYLLDRLFIWTTEGMTGPIEGFVRGMLPVPLADDSAAKFAQATRLMRERVQAVPISRWAKARPESMKVFPFQMQGLTTFGQTPMDIQVTPDGKLMVEEYNTGFAGNYPEEYKTLPPAIVTKRVEIDPEEIIAVRRYDKNGAMEYMPAIYLLQLQREYEMNTTGKIQTIAGVGSAVGGGGLSAAGKTGAGAVLARVDTAIAALSVVSMLVEENRAWLEEEGWGGFLDELDLVNTAASIYGLGRLVHGAPEMLRSLHESYASLRNRQRLATAPLSPEHAAVLQQIERQVSTLPKPPTEAAGREPPTAPPTTTERPPPEGGGELAALLLTGKARPRGEMAARKSDEPAPSLVRSKSREKRKKATGHREAHADTGIRNPPTDTVAATGTEDVAGESEARPRLEPIQGGKRDEDAPRAMAGDKADPSAAPGGPAPATAPSTTPVAPGPSAATAAPVAATPAEATTSVPTATPAERFAKHKAAKAEQHRKAELENLYAKAEQKAAKEGKGALDDLALDNSDFVNASARNKELAFDPAKGGWNDQSVAEARSVLDAEAKGQIDNPPVRRNLKNTSDFIDAKGVEIDHYGPKGLDPQADIDSLVVKLTQKSYDVLLDGSKILPADETKLIAGVRAKLLASGKSPDLLRRVISSRTGRLTP